MSAAEGVLVADAAPLRSRAPLRIAVSLQNHRPLAETIENSQRVTALGFHEIWTNENGHQRGLFVNAASIVAHNPGVELGIGIVNPFHRHPSAIAMEAATLDEASGGRVRLGVGAALWNLTNLGEADERTRRPFTATVESIRIIRALLRGGSPDFDSTVFTIRSDTRLDFEPFRPDLPVYAGAVNARMLRAAGRYADGVELGAVMSVGYIEWALGIIAEGARDGGSDPDALDIAAPLLVSVNEDAELARRRVRPELAYYLHRVEPVVRDHSGADPDDLRRVAAEVERGGIDAGIEVITDEIIDVFAAAGDPAHVATRLGEYAEAGIRGLVVQHIPGEGWVEGLELIADRVRPQVLTPETNGARP